MPGMANALTQAITAARRICSLTQQALPEKFNDVMQHAACEHVVVRTKPASGESDELVTLKPENGLLAQASIARAHASPPCNKLLAVFRPQAPLTMA